MCGRKRRASETNHKKTISIYRHEQNNQSHCNRDACSAVDGSGTRQQQPHQYRSPVPQHLARIARERHGRRRSGHPARHQFAALEPGQIRLHDKQGRSVVLGHAVAQAAGERHQPVLRGRILPHQQAEHGKRIAPLLFAGRNHLYRRDGQRALHRRSQRICHRRGLFADALQELLGRHRAALHPLRHGLEHHRERRRPGAGQRLCGRRGFLLQEEHRHRSQSGRHHGGHQHLEHRLQNQLRRGDDRGIPAGQPPHRRRNNVRD